MDRTFVRFTGTLWESDEFTPGVGWETVRIARRPRADTEGPYRLRLVDEADAVLVEVPVERRTDGCRRRETDGMDRERIVAYLPLPPAGRAIDLVRGDRILHRAELAPERPTVAIVDLVVDGEGQVRVRWEASHDRPLSFNVLFVDGRGRAIPVAAGVREPQLALATTELPGGPGCTLAVLATDGLRSGMARSDPFDLPERPPRVVIVSPADDGVLPPDQPLSLIGFALDPAGRGLPDERLVWMVDGHPIAEGQRLVATDPMAPGGHEIALIYRGDGDVTARAVARVAVAERSPEHDEWQRVSAALVGFRRRTIRGSRIRG